MNRSTLAAVVVALMLGSGIAGYLIGKPGDSIDRPTVPARTASAPAVTPPAATPAKTAPANATPPSTAPLPIAQAKPAPNEAFAYRRLGVDSSHPDAEACLYFNKPLATSDSVKLGDYVHIDPDVKSTVRAVDDKLCIGGLGYGQDYAVHLLSGLAAQDGTKLASEQKVDVALGARPAVVALPGKGFILPRGEAVGLPITTVNVSQVGIAVYRVGERGIDRFISEYSYDTDFPAGKPSTQSWTLRRWLNGSKGVLQWRGTMDVRNVLNQSVTTAFRRLLRRGMERRPAARQERRRQ
jgi:uncharacterized protein YfaS (alpha-2-macroglobulin family)